MSASVWGFGDDDAWVLGFALVDSPLLGICKLFLYLDQVNVLRTASVVAI